MNYSTARAEFEFSIFGPYETLKDAQDALIIPVMNIHELYKQGQITSIEDVPTPAAVLHMGGGELSQLTLRLLEYFPIKSPRSKNIPQTRFLTN